MTDRAERWHDQNDAVARELRASRPQPDPVFVEGLHGRLFADQPAPVPRRRASDWLPRAAWNWRPALAGAGLASLLAGTVLAIGVIGGGPLSPDGVSPSPAEQDCRYERIRDIRTVPTITTDRAGTPRVVQRRQIVYRRVKRCR